MSLIIRVAEDPGPAVRVSLYGRLDSATSPDFERRTDDLLDGPVESLVLDLEHLDYISSAGIGSLFRAKKHVEERGGRFAVVNPQPGVRKVFEIVRALKDLSVFASEREFDQYLDAMQRKANEGE